MRNAFSGKDSAQWGAFGPSDGPTPSKPLKSVASTPTGKSIQWDAFQAQEAVRRGNRNLSSGQFGG